MFDLDRFVADCHQVLGTDRPGMAVRDLVARAVARPSEVEASLGRPREGGLFCLHRSARLTILNVIWAPGMAIYPHEHRMWTVIGLYGGREDNTFYRRGARGLVAAGDKRLDSTDTALLGDSIIHAVANPLRAFTGAIHVYGGDFFATPRSEWTPDGCEERPWDIERARRAYAEANDRWRAEEGR
jgi:predicted metal-dependent enzyme (double-stranded beta helix superfamily)